MFKHSPRGDENLLNYLIWGRRFNIIQFIVLKIIIMALLKLWPILDSKRSIVKVLDIVGVFLWLPFCLLYMKFNIIIPSSLIQLFYCTLHKTRYFNSNPVSHHATSHFHSVVLTIKIRNKIVVKIISRRILNIRKNK